MPSDDDATLTWSGQFQVVSASSKLTGDKIILPPSALEQLLAAAPVIESDGGPQNSNPAFDPFNPYTFAAQRHFRAQLQFKQQQLPHPLTFRLVNAKNNRVVFAGIKEFSADEGECHLSPFLAQALGIDVSDTNLNTSNEKRGSSSITVHAKQVPKGTFVKLRPLEAGYDPEDWKSLLEEYMRKNFTTLSKGEVITVPAGREQYQFLLDSFEPKGDSICVVDTDLEVDIEALNEEQARETLQKIAEKSRKGPGSEEGSSKGGDLPFLRLEKGQILPGDFVDYQLPSWSRTSWLDIAVETDDDNFEVNLLASPYNERQRARPRLDEAVFGDYECRGPKRLRLSPTNIELENAEALWISVFAPQQDRSESSPKPFTIRASAVDERDVNGSSNAKVERADPNEKECPNCHKYVPSQSLLLHEGYCRRNNIACPKGCGLVFQKSTISSHWHCDLDTSFGNTASSLQHHNETFHTSHPCPSPLCNFIGSTLPALAQHRTTTCPGKEILCRFCHLVVPQEGDPDGVPNAEALISGLTPHEVVDGGRTTECHICSRIVRLRDMSTHLLNHDQERKTRPRPRVCRNVNCARTLDGASKSGDTRSGARMGQGAGNDVGLCSQCFGPIYVTSHDPEGKALKRRVERRYLTQLVGGCGKQWCRNKLCKDGMKHLGKGKGEALTTKDALPLVKPYVDALLLNTTSQHFCVDEASQRRRTVAEMMAAEGAKRGPGVKAYEFAWCIGALEAEGGNLDKAREWLKNFAPTAPDVIEID